MHGLQKKKKIQGYNLEYLDESKLEPQTDA